MKILMHPHIDNFDTEESGIRRVVENYFKHLPNYGIELVGPKENHFDAVAIHVAGNQSRLSPAPVILHCHGLYWTADYPADAWQWRTNAWAIDTARAATMITVPSNWVAESFARDMRIMPEVVPHGIDLDEWGDPTDHAGYVLWNKNRAADVCDPFPVISLARRFSKGSFLTTVLPAGAARPNNVKEIGLQDYQTMRGLVKGALVYLATTKETFGIGILEAMASGVPTLGFNHGGITDLIEHGVTGYLASPGDYDDLANGALYCIEHREVLGDNAREAVKVWTWKKAAEQVAGIYRGAVKKDAQPWDVSVVIPCYNYGDKVGRAIESACNQTVKPLEIIVVDDGSDQVESDRALDAVAVARRKFPELEIRLVAKDNGGVATARNVGVQEATGRLICCIDADDAIEPDFLSYCQRAFSEDRSLGIAYTGILAIDKDSNQEVSKWPPEFNYGDQVNRYNQIPTCCVYKKEMWERLGGYRQRYAPGGAGAEDAEFWLRAGAYGFDAKKVTAKPLFIYSLGTGRVSGDPEYKEVDWTTAHPWVKDHLHPFGSRAAPAGQFSHPVRQYDNPAVSVIIPVGPGHHDTLIDALDSLEAQTFRNWEAIVVWDSVPPADFIKMYSAAYPYVKNRVSYSKVGGSVGAGGARNLGASVARGAFFVFLDADDRLYPHALEAYLEAWAETKKGIVYSDYVGRTFVSEDYRQEAEREGRLLNYNPKTGASIIAYKSAAYDCELAQRQPEYTGDPHMPFYHWCLVTCLIPRDLHFAIDGFDDKMPSWEDVDYHWRIAQRGECYYHLKRELVVYQMHTGQRRERGLQSHADLVQYMKGKYEGGSRMGCSKCPGGQAAATARQNSPFNKGAAQNVPGPQGPSDNDFIWAMYNSPNRGDHRVIGVATFQYRIEGPNMLFRDGMWKIDYGYIAGGSGDPVLAHRRDVEQMPFFVPVAQTVQPQQAAVPLSEPPPVRGPQRPPASAAQPAPASAKSHVDVMDTAAIPDEWVSEIDGLPVEIEASPAAPVPETVPDVDMSSLMGPKIEDVQPDPDAAKVVIEADPFNWQIVPGVGPELAEQLMTDGYHYPQQLTDEGAVKYLMGFEGIGTVKAGRIVGAVQSYLRRQEAMQAQAEQEAASGDQ